MEVKKMDITISENLKNLRRDKGNTQDDLARHLGISVQAISKWERGDSFPDITLLPATAEYYGVSVDELLGVGASKREERILAILQEQKRYYDGSEDSDKIEQWQEFLRGALREFPNEYRIMERYMVALSPTRDGVVQVEREHYDEIAALGERILAECTDDGIRQTTQIELSWFYAACGETEKAKRYAESLPDVWRAATLLPLVHGAELFTVAWDFICKGFVMVNNSITHLNEDGDITPEQRGELDKLLEHFVKTLQDAAAGK
jgi:transcriptional regulator with XRE-family HTH domain